MRTYEKMEEDTFEKVIREKVFNENSLSIAQLLNKKKMLVKDISKIFGKENQLETANFSEGLGIGGITGIVKLGDFMFLGIEAKTEGNYPVYFILYVKHYIEDFVSEIRGYVPEKGNTFNKDTRRPYKENETNIKCNEQELIEDISRHFYRFESAISYKRLSLEDELLNRNVASQEITKVLCTSCCKGVDLGGDILMRLEGVEGSKITTIKTGNLPEETYEDHIVVYISLRDGAIVYDWIDESKYPYIDCEEDIYDAEKYNIKNEDDLKLLREMFTGKSGDIEIESILFYCQVGQDEIFTPYIELDGKQALIHNHDSEKAFAVAILDGTIKVSNKMKKKPPVR